MIRRNQAGQVLVTTALGLVMLLGFAGLAVDVGVMRYQRRVQQTAADGAAIAGALDLSFGSGVTAGAQNSATQNGFSDGAGCSGGAGSVGCVSVAVNNGPLTGPHAGNAAYVEVIVTAIQPTYFMKIFGVNSEPIKARAVATNVSGGTNASCLYTLGKPSASIEGVNVQGNAHLLAPNCGISDNGNFDTTGNGYSVTSKTLGVSGACTGTDCGTPNVTCTAFPNGQCPPIGGAPATGDPLTGLTPPAQPAKSTTCPASGACDYTSSGTVTIQPGTYSSILIGSNSVVTMAPGLYYINGSGGLGFNGKGTLTDAGSAGVMIYFTGTASLNKVNGGGNIPDIQLTPMTTAESVLATGSDKYAGILFYQDPNDLTSPWFGGDNNSTFNGTVYFPTQKLNFYGNTSINFNGTVIADSVGINGNPTVNFGVSPAGIPVPAKLTAPVLVE
jgi:Flp pilus assembly protein TadG